MTMQLPHCLLTIHVHRQPERITSGLTSLSRLHFRFDSAVRLAKPPHQLVLAKLALSIMWSGVHPQTDAKTLVWTCPMESLNPSPKSESHRPACLFWRACQWRWQHLGLHYHTRCITLAMHWHIHSIEFVDNKVVSKTIIRQPQAVTTSIWKHHHQISKDHHQNIRMDHQNVANDQPLVKCHYNVTFNIIKFVVTRNCGDRVFQEKPSQYFEWL